MTTGKPPGLLDGGRGSNVNIDGAIVDSGNKGDGRINPLCGATGLCGFQHIPDDPVACEHVDAGEPQKPPPRDGGRIVDTFDANGIVTADAGIADAGKVAPPLDASVAPSRPDASATGVGEGGIVEAGADGYVEPPPSVPENPGAPYQQEYACQVVSDSNGRPVHQCVRAGSGGVGAPCTSTSNCRAGLACVGQAGAGECRPYCCDEAANPCGLSSREDGSVTRTFCGERLLLEPGRAPSLQVPVCVPAEGCSLGRTYPCTGSDCQCEQGKACTVVSAGTTGCLYPGSGKVGDACPCAAGYYCSAQNTCVKICATLDPNSCAPGKCQATAGFPDGYGRCVGASPTLQ